MMLGRILVPLLLAAFAALSGGCNTIAGAGKDIERGGQAIRDAAKEVQRRL